jgi:hypothetical protein
MDAVDAGGGVPAMGDSGGGGELLNELSFSRGRPTKPSYQDTNCLSSVP